MERRKLNLKATFESGSSYFSFKRSVPGAYIATRVWEVQAAPPYLDGNGRSGGGSGGGGGGRCSLSSRSGGSSGDGAGAALLQGRHLLPHDHGIPFLHAAAYVEFESKS